MGKKIDVRNLRALELITEMRTVSKEFPAEIEISHFEISLVIE